LTEENEKLSKFNDQLKSDISIVLESFREKQSLIPAFKSDIDLMKNDVFIANTDKQENSLLRELLNLLDVMERVHYDNSCHLSRICPKYLL